MLKTETPSTAHTTLDQYPTDQLIHALVDDQFNAVHAVRAASAQLARAVDAAAARLIEGGRLIYVGAGTSGRLGLLDSVELYPTFSWPRERAVALLAGGPSAVYQAVEGAEDNFEQGSTDIMAVGLKAMDVLLLLAASGNTPYAMGALAASRSVGALSIGIANNALAPLATQADIGITLDTGAELISGSTRLKAGTAQKIALNTFSSAVMVRLHKVYGNLMVDLKPTNAKLLRRAVALTALVSGASEELASQTLKDCAFQVKVAIVALKNKVSAAQATQLLAEARDNLRLAIGEP
ncbi:MAG: N-acetylmuramic acid 6-phosphate etherase [Comamonadaceae bacterium]|nr:MAG: N-acetylmuramic acid 6-phosphate etherase [Comamonadaceae bacterium]